MGQLKPMRNPFFENDEKWIAVCQHNHHYDNVFWYANRESKNGKYCYPSCTSRTNYSPITSFTWFENMEEAEKLEYTACKRCHADDPNHISPKKMIENVESRMKKESMLNLEKSLRSLTTERKHENLLPEATENTLDRNNQNHTHSYGGIVKSTEKKKQSKYAHGLKNKLTQIFKGRS